MKLTIKATPKEIAALVLAIQEQQGALDSINFEGLSARISEEAIRQISENPHLKAQRT